MTDTIVYEEVKNGKDVLWKCIITSPGELDAVGYGKTKRDAKDAAEVDRWGE